jgi:AAA15 family ATPase/GTPase
MLLRFRVTNFASIRDEAELSMVAASQHEDIAVRPADDSGISVLPAAAIYGANASGKSNVVDALVFMRSAILGSHQDWRPGAAINRRAFKLDAASKQKPSTFVINFVHDGVHHEYGFSVGDYNITEEWLYSYPKKRARLLFERTESDGMKFGPSLTGLRQNIAKLMRPNSLYLSTAAANNHPQLRQIYNWFVYRIIPIRAGSHLYGSFTLHQWQNHDKTPLRDLLRYADTGVVDLEVEEQELPESATERYRELLKEFDVESSDSVPLRLPPKVEFIHQGAEETARLSIDEESSGTLAWLLLAGPVVSTIRHGGILIVDELDDRLHPLLAAHLVSIFQNTETNPAGAQLLFNTHNVSLLGPSASGRLRRDQVWFTEKDNDGATRLTALAEYRVRDGLENVEKRYLAGRYGAIPFLDDVVLESLRDE